ncbi:MAG: DNA polymerase III subunit beta [Proteobacteria bacterium]|nr:DNA polymerase III subunit beta [Pseudomonadota bacterium]
MLLSIEKDKLSRLLHLAHSVVERKNTMPILANIKLTADKKKLSFAATNLEVSLTGEVDADIDTKGSTTVDAKVFYDIIKELPNERIVLKLVDDKRLDITCGKSNFKINTTSSDEFPNLAGVKLENPAVIDASMLYEMFDKTAFAVSSDESRLNINGVLVEFLKTKNSSNIRFVATDGHRLAMIERNIDGINEFKSVIVPRKAIVEIKKILEGNDGAAKVEISESFITIASKEVTIGVRLVDGQFPDYMQVVPKEHNTKFDVKKDEFLSAVRRVSLMTADKNKAVKFSIKGSTMTISSSSAEFGEAVDSIEIEKQGNDVEVGFSARYVAELLSAISEDQMVTVKLNGNLSPGIFNPKDMETFTCVVMPMRFE